MKGADINLEKVLTADDAVKKTYADSLKKYILMIKNKNKTNKTNKQNTQSQQFI
jgi:hypothetical protein